MGFLAVCTALYDYEPQSEGELAFNAGDILYILEKSGEDAWWKAKRRVAGDSEEEPEGLVPNTYVEDAAPQHTAKALYDYERQTDEEVSFSEHATLDVFDSDDSDWTLVGVDGDYGFAPTNYIEITTASSHMPAAAAVASPVRAVPLPPREAEPEAEPSPPASPIHDPHSAAANLARVIGGGAPAMPQASRQIASPPPTRAQIVTPDASDDEAAPAMPPRPASQVIPSTSIHTASPTHDRAGVHSSEDFTPLRSPGGYHLYNVSEMVSSMGRRKKMPCVLGLNVATGTIMLTPTKGKETQQQVWTADKMDHYSIEGKHVFLELVKPSKSLDLHAGAKDTAAEIVRSLGEIAGAHRAVGLKEVIASTMSGGQKKGVVVYEFMAQGDDEVTVAVGDEVIILDDTASSEWWNVRRVKNGNEGVVPSSYIEVTGTISAEPSRAGINAGKSTVQQNREEEQRLAKEAARRDRQDSMSRDLAPPDRSSSLGESDRDARRRDQKSGKSDGKPRSKPDLSKVRTWTDHSGSFKVEAQFIGIADGKVHLHKVNGVKIAVPVAKMSPPDLEFVEKVTKLPLDDDIPIADLLKMKNRKAQQAGASFESTNGNAKKTSEYDWFEFFLQAGVGVHQCERYAQAMVRDNMEESVLPDISMETLRTLGLKEGDCLKVMKFIDAKIGRSRAPTTTPEQSTGGLFAGPGGAIKNNTGRQRPEANRSASDSVNADAFQPATKSESSAPAPPQKNAFDDDAWTPKTSTPQPQAQRPPQSQPPSQNMQDLSLLEALQPEIAQPTRPQATQPTPQPQTQYQPQSQPQAQQSGATPQLFAGVSALQNQSTMNAPRSRPQPPQQNFAGSALLPPPQRPMSAPQNAPQNGYNLPSLVPQMTGLARPSGQGPSLDDMTAQRMQQYAAQQAQLQQQSTGYLQPQVQNGYANGLQPVMTGFPGTQPQSLPYMNGMNGLQAQPTGFVQMANGGPVNNYLPPALVPQATGIQANALNRPQQPLQPQSTFQPQSSFGQALQSQPTGFQQPQMTSFQSPQLQPQSTGFPQSQAYQQQQQQMNGTNGTNGYNVPLPPMPADLQGNHAPAALTPQKTGPAPNISFGMAKKLAPQPTGRRANLANATPDNPFGF